MSPWPCPLDNRVRDFNGLANPLPCLSVSPSRGCIQGMHEGKNRGRVVWLRYGHSLGLFSNGDCNVWVVARTKGDDKGVVVYPVTSRKAENPPLVRIHRCDDTLISRVTNWVRLMRSGAFNDVIWRNAIPSWTPSVRLVKSSSVAMVNCCSVNHRIYGIVRYVYQNDKCRLFSIEIWTMCISLRTSI